MPTFRIILALIVLLGAATVYAIVRVQNVQRHQNDALHTIICTVESHELSFRHPSPTPARKREIASFWASELSAAHLAPCDH